MTPHDPPTLYRITADFLTGKPGNDRLRATLTIQDLTAIAHPAETQIEPHNPLDTQLFHIRFGDVDHDAGLDVLRGMSVNFLDFYARLQETRDDERKALLPLPALPLTQESLLDGPDWVSGVEAYLKTALRFHEQIEALRRSGGEYLRGSVCAGLILVRYPVPCFPADLLLSASIATVPHCHCIVERAEVAQQT